MTDWLTPEKEEKLRQRWASALQSYPSLSVHGSTPWDSGGFSEAALSDFKALSSAPAQQPAQQVAQQPTQVPDRPIYPYIGAGAGGYWVDAAAKMGTALTAATSLIPFAPKIYGSSWSSSVPGYETAKRLYPTMAGTGEERKAARDAIAETTDGGFMGWLAQSGANVTPLMAGIVEPLVSVGAPAMGAVGLGVEHGPGAYDPARYGLPEGQGALGSLIAKGAVGGSGPLGLERGWAQKFGDEDDIITRLTQEEFDKADKSSPFWAINAHARAYERARRSGVMPWWKEMMVESIADIPFAAGGVLKAATKGATKLAASRAAAKLAAQDEAARALGRQVTKPDWTEPVTPRQYNRLWGPPSQPRANRLWGEMMRRGDPDVQEMEIAGAFRDETPSLPPSLPRPLVTLADEAVPDVSPTEARVLVPDDPSLYGKGTGIGGDLADIRQPSGSPVRGRIISPDDPMIPDEVYHVTTNAVAVRSDGIIRARGAGGLGGDEADEMVAFTTNKEIADQLALDLRLASEIANMPEDSLAIGERLLRQATEEGWVEPGYENFRRLVEFAREGTHERSAKYWLKDYFGARVSGTGGFGVGKRDPIIYSDRETLRRIAEVDVITVPKSSLKAWGAMVTDFDLSSGSGLDEVRVYGDVPINPNTAPQWTTPAPRTPVSPVPESIPSGELPPWMRVHPYSSTDTPLYYGKWPHPDLNPWERSGPVSFRPQTPDVQYDIYGNIKGAEQVPSSPMTMGMGVPPRRNRLWTQRADADDWRGGAPDEPTPTTVESPSIGPDDATIPTQDYFGLDAVLGPKVAGAAYASLKSLGRKIMGGSAEDTAELAAESTERAAKRKYVAQIIDSQGARVASRFSLLLRPFVFDANGGIPNLAGAVAEIPWAPTIHDVAARLPLYRRFLNDEQIEALNGMRREMDYIARERNKYDLGAEDIGMREDVMRPVIRIENGVEVIADEGGFYLPRGYAGKIEDASERFRIEAIGGLFDSPLSRKRGAPGYEKPAYFDSAAEGISEGYRYLDVDETMHLYVKAVGQKVKDKRSALDMQSAIDPRTGEFLGQTPKQVAMGLKGGADLLDNLKKLNAQLSNLRATHIRLAERSASNFDELERLFNLRDTDAGIDEFAKAFTRFNNTQVRVVRGQYKGDDLADLNQRIADINKSINELREPYRKLMIRARNKSGRGSIDLPNLSGWSFEDEVAKAYNKVLRSERPPDYAATPVIGQTLGAANFLNRLHRGVGATLDLSSVGIQGLLMSYRAPDEGWRALQLSVRAFGTNDKAILGAFYKDFDSIAKGFHPEALTAKEWASLGVHLSELLGEYQLTGALARIPGVERANRAFGVAGTTMRLRAAHREWVTQIRAGRTPQEIIASGDAERIANAVNAMTGFVEGRAFNDAGDLLLFAPRFLQSRFDTVAMAARGTAKAGRSATIDERIARRAMLQMLSFGVLLTVGMNMAFGEGPIASRNKGVFTPFVTRDGDLVKNPDFLKIQSPIGKISAFGTWDSLLTGFLHIMAGDTPRAFRSLGSGTTSVLWDQISGTDFRGQRVNPLKYDDHEFIGWVSEQFAPFALQELVPGVGEEAALVDVAEGAVRAATGDVSAGLGQMGRGAAASTVEILGVKRAPVSKWAELSNEKQELMRAIGIMTFGDVLDELGYGDVEVFSELDRDVLLEPKHLPTLLRNRLDVMVSQDERLAKLSETAEDKGNPDRRDYYRKDEEELDLLVAKLTKLKEDSAKEDSEHPMWYYNQRAPGLIKTHYDAKNVRRDAAVEKGIIPSEYEPEGIFREAEDVINRVMYADDEAAVIEHTGSYEPTTTEYGEFNWEEYERRKVALQDKYGKKFYEDMRKASLEKRFPEDHPERERREMNSYLEQVGYSSAAETVASQLGLTTEWEAYNRLTRGEMRAAREQNPDISMILKRARELRKDMRRMDPTLEEIIMRWGHSTKGIHEVPTRGRLAYIGAIR